MDGPRAEGIELGVSAPVTQGAAGLLHFFVSQGKVIVRVSVSGRELDGLLVGAGRFGKAAGFIEHVAQVEVGQGIARVGGDGGAVVLLRSSVIAAVVKQRS